MKRNNFYHAKLSMALATAALTMSGVTTPVSAQAAETLKPIVVTAARMAEDPGNISADVTVLDARALEKSQKSTVADVLRAQAGVDVASSGGPGKTTSVFLRGANSGQTLVLVDGVRVGSATLGAFDWAHLSTADIERIEIVRGPQSSLYGADAMGGVIQIFTRQGRDGLHAHVSAEGGTYRTGKTDVHVSGKTAGGVGYAIGVSGLSTKGISAAANAAERDPYRRLTGSAHFTAPLAGGALELLLRDVEGHTSFDSSTPADKANFNGKARQSVSSIKYSRPLADFLDTSLQLSRSTDIANNSDPVTSFNNSDFRTDIDQISWLNHADFDTLSLLVGAEWRRDKGFSSSSKLDKSFTQSSVFGGFSYNMRMLSASASLRYDANSASRNKTTYKFGAVLHPFDGVQLTANYGTGFKAPSINNLYFPGFGNPNLLPEQSKGWDVGIRLAQDFGDGKLTFGATWFDQRFTNLIVFQTSATKFLSRPENLSKARTNGLELSARLAYGPAYVRGNWTFLHAVDSVSGSRLARRAKDKGSIIGGFDIAGLNLEVQHDIVGPRFSKAFNQKLMQGYGKTDIRARYALGKQVALLARVENVGNKSYEEVKGFGVPGRSWYAGVSADF